MRIRYFGKLIEVENLKDHILKNSTVVVDASNFFFRLYQQSGLEYVFGCDSDKYANYIREYLNMFKRANVKCFFIFKGGHDTAKGLVKVRDKLRGNNFDINESYEDIVFPIFDRDVCTEVLDEMDFAYTICEYESKKECIALAQKLKCPVISYDIEFCFSGLPYIMQSTLKFDEQNNRIECGIFLLDEFLKNRNLTEKKLTLFTALTDETNFPNNHFQDVIMELGIHNIQHYKRNQNILAWLAETSRTRAQYLIFRYMKKEDKRKFLEVEQKHRKLIRRQETPGIPVQYLENGNELEVNEKDQFWFQKGVASKHIPFYLVNPARTGIIAGTWAIADYTQDDAKLLSMEIIKYTYNLLTNFEKEECVLYINNQEILVPLTNSISKPDYDGINSPFENGWKQLKGEMFKHFLNEALQVFDYKVMEKLPEDLKMLMIALIYFSGKKSVCTRNEVCSVLLSYVALSVVNESDKNENLNEDKLIAKDVLEKYFDVEMVEKRRIFDVKMLHPLVEFQHCLQSLNYLNVLCGKLFEPTTYNKTYNATFVYKVLYSIKTEFKGNCMDFLKQTLNTAPTVLSYIQHLMKVFDDVMESL